MAFEEDVVADVIKRLRRVEGQVAGIIRMIEAGRDCKEVITQISAAGKALDQSGFKLLASGLRMCVKEPGASQDGYTEEELERMFLKLA